MSLPSAITGSPEPHFAHQAVGMPADDAAVSRAAAAYRDGYRRVRQPVAGAAQLLSLVREHADARVNVEETGHEARIAHADQAALAEALRVGAGAAAPR